MESVDPMAHNVAPIVVSRSAIATRKLCEMKRFNAYHRLHPDYQATGQVGGLAPIDETTTGFAKLRGQLIHTCLDLAVKGEDWQDWLMKQPAMLPPPFGTLMEAEQKLWSCLIRRAVQGWLNVRWHGSGQLSQDFEAVSAEEEWSWQLHPLVAQSLRMDQIWRRKTDGGLMIVDFKTMSRPDANWIDRLRNSDQTHLYVQALVERTQEPVIGIQYEGIILGSKDKDGRHKSPFINFYNKGAGLSTKWSAGSAYYSTTHMRDSDWLGLVGPDLQDLYTTTGPLYPPPAQLLQTKDATVAAEVEWADKIARLEACADTYGADSQEYDSLKGRLIERNAEACLKFGWGYACPYMGLCWDAHQPDTESFMPRIDHHAIPEETT